MTDEQKLESMGWIITCLSPLEIEHNEGSKASGLAAQYAMAGILEDYEPDVDPKLKKYLEAEAELIDDIEMGKLDYFEARTRRREIYKLIPLDVAFDLVDLSATMYDQYGEAS